METRASKYAYITDLTGSHVVTFQFNPSDVSGDISNNIYSRVNAGSKKTDVSWISGTPETYTIQLFIDRTEESTKRDYINSGSSSIKPSILGSALNEALETANSLVLGNTVIRSLATAYANGKQGSDGNLVRPSEYLAGNPKMEATDYEVKTIGVLKDFESLKYFLDKQRQVQSNARLTPSGVIENSELSDELFIPSPKALFICGPIWKEGYISAMQYSLTEMSKDLVPRRLSATLTMVVINSGILEPITNDSVYSAELNRI